MAEPARAILGGREAAESFVGSLIATMAALEAVLRREADHLAAGRVRAGLSEEREKTSLAARYLRDLEYLKSNAVALARFAPDAVARLKRAHHGFRAVVEQNQAVVATARSVSEGLIKSVAEDVARQRRPRSYGSAPPARPVSAQPIVYSARL